MPLTVREDGTGSVQRALARCRLRWTRRHNSEVGFWHMLLDPDPQPGSGRSKKDTASIKQWLRTGDVRWAWESDEERCGTLARTHGREGYNHGPPRILSTGSGPLAPAPLTCKRP